MPKHLNITVHGRVQGVGFRHAARGQARYLGIKGYVKNKPDGSVYIEAEGDDTALALYVKWCRQGPPFAHVEDINVQTNECVGFVGFDARI